MSVKKLLASKYVDIRLEETLKVKIKKLEHSHSYYILQYIIGNQPNTINRKERRGYAEKTQRIHLAFSLRLSAWSLRALRLNVLAG